MHFCQNILSQYHLRCHREPSQSNDCSIQRTTMVQGLKFLSKKSFNPQNLSNQKTVWERQQEQKNEAKRAKEREDQLKRERDDQELARARGGETASHQAALNFMYAPPPGMVGPDGNKNKDETERLPTVEGKEKLDLTQRQPGDDDAAAAFRLMLAQATQTKEKDNNDDNEAAVCVNDVASSLTSAGAALSGTTIEGAMKKNDHLSSLEKAVGRKDAGAGLTLDEQIARFPQLKNAPMAKGMNSTNVNVNFKPLGTQLRHVRCLACGVWGHSKGDRECDKTGWNPFSISSVGPTTTTHTSSSSIQKTSMEKELNAPPQEREEPRKRRSYESHSSDSEDSYDRRRRKRKKHKRRKERRKRTSRSSSPEGEERRSRKTSDRRKKSSSRRQD